MSEELKPCPFCGGPAKLLKVQPYGAPQEERMRYVCALYRDLWTEEGSIVEPLYTHPAIPAQEAGIVTPLEWRHYPDAFPPMWVARGAFGHYSIEESAGSDSPTYDVFQPILGLMANVDGLPEAKAAAQADYERSILSALHPTPAHSGERGALTVDDLAQEIRRVDGSNSMGAGALAEALMSFIAKLAASEGTKP